MVSSLRSSSLFIGKRQRDHGPGSLFAEECVTPGCSRPSVSRVRSRDDVDRVQAQNSRLRPHLPAAPAAAPRLPAPWVTGRAGLLWVSSSFRPLTHACAHSWAGRVLRSSREPGGRCQTVPAGGRGGALQEARDSRRRRCGRGAPGQAGRPRSGLLESGGCDRAPGAWAPR